MDYTGQLDTLISQGVQVLDLLAGILGVVSVLLGYVVVRSMYAGK